MRYGSVCSGIEAATVAWHPLGWQPDFFSEIDKSVSRVLAHHYPTVPNLGDMTKFREWPDYELDLLVGGTPCQSFSVAGLRKGLLDPRGNLMLTFLGVADKYRPKWVVWENVPGVLSSSGGRDFGALLGALAELGYGWAYRVLDAQYVRVDGFGRAVPQRRRRVFVVGCLGDWRRAAAVLFERESLCGNTPPRRQAGQGTAHDVAPSLTSSGRGVERGGDTRGQDPVIAEPVSKCLNAGAMGRIDSESESESFVAHSLRASGFDASEDGTGRGTPLVPVAIQERAICENPSAGPAGVGVRQDGAAYTLEARSTTQAVAYDFFNITAPVNRQNRKPGDPCHTLARDNASSATIIQRQSQQWAVRRLTPTECERLQGFPEISNQVRFTIWDCAEKARYAALAVTQNLRSPNSALSAEGDGSAQFASAVAGRSNSNHLPREKPVDLHVLIDLERQRVVLNRAGKLIWSASTAESPNSSPLSMPLDSFALLLALMPQILAKEARNGRGGSPANTNSSSPQPNGSASVHVSGQEIAEFAAGVERFMRDAASFITSTTSQVGQDFQNSERILETWCCCVAHAIGSFIPKITHQESSFSVIVEAVSGYTYLADSAKPQADGPRYKQLGNSMAVNVMRWIGTRIQMVEDAMAESDAA